ncbi:glycosyltransferase [Parafrigoribacterium soli]|uniref:glycosyltransferase n=1 Tax=Parafrigoribacterium soli TaxID=3144663 RepID=UPI0032ED1441
MRKHTIAKKLMLILWDFFPIHQLEIGRISRAWPTKPLKALERIAISRADVVALMTPANERFFRSYHPDLRSETIVIPPWSSSGSDEATERPAKFERFTVVFGGQLAKGRGVDTLLAAAALLQNTGEDIDITIAGDGTERMMLESEAERLHLKRVEFTGALPRTDYRALLQRAHVGLAITVAGVTPPSFPSKIVEYCGLGLPVVVCVEASSDAGTIVENSHAGISVPVGDAAGVANAIRTLYADFHDGIYTHWERRARRFYETKLSTNKAVERIEQYVKGNAISVA